MPDQFTKTRAAGEIGSFISAISACDKRQVRQYLRISRGCRLQLLRPLHHLQGRCLAREIVRQPWMRLAPQNLVKRIPPHVAVDQKHLAVLVASQAQRQVRRDKAFTFLGETAAHQDRLQRADVAQLKDPRTQAAKLLDCGSALKQRRQLRQGERPGPRGICAQIQVSTQRRADGSA